MSEKVRSLNLTTGNVLTTSISTTTTLSSSTPTATSSAGTLIGAPTLISSTFSGSTTSQILLGNAAATTTTTTSGALTTLSGVMNTSNSSETTSNPMMGDSNVTTATNNRHRNNLTSLSEVENHEAESSTDYASGPGGIMAQLNLHLLPASSASLDAVEGDDNSLMTTSQISANSNESSHQLQQQQPQTPNALNGNIEANDSLSNSQIVKLGTGNTNNGKHLKAQSVAGKSCRFPKLEECAHFHYERVQLGPLSVRLVDDVASQSIGGDIASSTGNNLNITSTSSVCGPSSLRSFSPNNCWFIIKVFPHQSDPFLVKRSFENMEMFDEMLHRCVYDRKISGLRNLQDVDFKTEEEVEYAVAKYLERFSKIASDSLTCGTILTWLQLDNKGRRLPLADSETMRTINTPAVGAAYGVRRYQAQASDEISIEVGDMISVIDMPSPAESVWWRGKKSHLQKSHYEVGFFPQACVATIGDKVPRNFPMPAPLVGQLDVSPTKPVLRKHGKLIAFFRSFILSRPSRRRLKQKGIYRERVFSCDLSEHLLNSGQDIPMVLKCCAEFIEEYGVVDGIYRLSGITSNIQRLRRAFDEERIPDLGNPEAKQDIHAVSSLLKMYFRELPNPLCTYQLYDNFVEAIQEKSESSERLRLMKETVLKLPPPHYRTLKYLSQHLHKLAQHADRTNMTDKNLAIVWAPNLLRSPALESGGVAALRGVGVQAVVTEYLIRNCNQIFDALDDPNARFSYIATANAMPTETRMDSLTDCESLLVEQREHDQSSALVERPKSLSTAGPKLISLEEAQERHSKLDSFDIKTSMPISMMANNAANIGSYIEVGGGPSSLPDKYHTVLSAPRSWQKRKTHSWKSIFTRNQRPVSNGPHELKSGLAVASLSTSTEEGTEDDIPPLRRPANQVANVTFKDKCSTPGWTGTKPLKSSLHKQEKPKSIDLFETAASRHEPNKTIEVCVRSNSIDSLRTAAGHSRSVSHDSYFDLLQSPQRINVAAGPSRELSELGINFDREEPEMRLFSESESLVSSPRVGKENIAPSSASVNRRILRARPEEFSSQTNSVNPSPKKQPRLNLLSPHSAGRPMQNNRMWPLAGPNANCLHAGEDPALCHQDAAQGHHSSDESCCKRYKLEDQLSDIQYIDCSTPEHAMASTSVYTSAQVHDPPKSALSKSTLYGSHENANKIKETFENASNKTTTKSPSSAHAQRYSYPTVQLGSKRKEQESKERFSYPITTVNGNDRHYPLTESPENHMQIEEMDSEQRKGSKEIQDSTNFNLPQIRTVSFMGPPPPKPPHLPRNIQQQEALLGSRNRNSFSGTNEVKQLSMEIKQQSGLRGSYADISKDGKYLMDSGERCKHSITPSSPLQSPRYSLLASETSSEHSSAINTPQCDLDPLMVASTMSGLSAFSGNTSSQQQQYLLGVDVASCLGTSHESLGSNFASLSPHQQHMSCNEKRDMHAVKRELSLDLNTLGSKVAGYEHLQSHKHQHQQQLAASPSAISNFTDNTSQSVTPSEFGYQNLQRQSSMHSLIETSENSGIYDDYENTPSNLVSPLGDRHHHLQQQQQKLPSPIKATINITYNLKSPKHEFGKDFDTLIREKEQSAKTGSRANPKVLETSFDENDVYEQVKIFRNSVTEVNQLLSDDAPASPKQQQQQQQQMQKSKPQKMKNIIEENPIAGKDGNNSDSSDIQMCEQNNTQTTQDEDETFLYENVEFRKPQSVYANLLGEDMKAGPKVNANVKTITKTTNNDLSVSPQADNLELDSLEENPRNSNNLTENQNANTQNAARRSPSNFSVKELATKFESSPVEQLPAFDFSIRSSIKKQQNTLGEPKVSSQLSLASQKHYPQKQTQQQQQQQSQTSPLHKTTDTSVNSIEITNKLNKTQQHTRSLDENAFIREFGATKTHADIIARSTHQLQNHGVISNENVSNRRKSFDFARPKTLNPPKRLPGMPIAEEICHKNIASEKVPSTLSPLKLEAFKERHFNSQQEPTSLGNENSSIEHDFESTELKITPTTENRISLIQNNVDDQQDDEQTSASSPTADLNNSNLSHASSSGNILSGVKLDRERIDRIKEERRQQLTQKYRVDVFKSKSKQELNLTNDDNEKFPTVESLRIKSKSRGDMHTLQKDIENFKEFAGVGIRQNATSAGSETTLHTTTTQQQQHQQQQQQHQQQHQNNHHYPNYQQQQQQHQTLNEYGVVLSGTHRVRSISDEKNQNCDPISTMNSNANNSSSSSAVPRMVAKITSNSTSRNSLSAAREKISPQFSIRDVTAMFESRSQNQQ